MAATALTVENAKSANIDIIEDGRGSGAVHEMVTAMRANRRTGSAHTKTRGEVAGNNAKPWRQKGTGRARAGRITSPIWRGGGVVFGPRHRDYSKKVTKGIRRLAFRKALSERIKDGDVLTAASFAISDGKTKSFVKEVNGLVGADVRRVLIIGNGFDDNTYLSGRNVGNMLLMTAAEVNVENILHYNKIIVVGDALETLAARTAAKK
jgi:large subunit ribosomal protein L4